jgi:hypothetical protein
MSILAGGNTRLLIKKETAWGETFETSAMYVLSEEDGASSIANERPEIINNLLRPDLQKEESRLGVHTPSKTVNNYLTGGVAMEMILQGALGGTFVNAYSATVGATVTAGDKDTIVGATGVTFPVSILQAGEMVKLTFETTSANDGYYTIASSTTGTIVLTEDLPSAITVEEDVTILLGVASAEAGTTINSHFIEEQYVGMGSGTKRFSGVNGLLVDTMNITASVNEFVKVATTFSSGKQKLDPYTASKASSVIDQTELFDKMIFEGATITKDGASIGIVTSLGINIARSTEGIAGLGSKYNQDAVMGLIVPELSASVMMKDLSWFETFEKEDLFAIKCIFSEKNSSGDEVFLYEFDFPKVKIVSDPVASKSETKIEQSITMKAFKGLASSSVQTCKVTRKTRIEGTF